MEPSTMKTLLLVLSSILLVVGFSSGPLITRLYFIHGGQSLWLSSSLQTAGFPLILIPLSILYFKHPKTRTSGPKLVSLSPFLFLSSSFLGLLMATIDYLYAYGSARLPVSTSTLINPSQLAFTAAFAYVVLKQKLSVYSVNAVVLLITGTVVLGLHGSSDRPAGESEREYYMGFFMMVAASILYAIMMTSTELSFKKGRVQDLSYNCAMEFNLVLCFSATSFSLLGMLINNDFQAIPREAKEYMLGESKYYLILITNAIVWQFGLLGMNGVIFCGSSLLSSILVALSIPFTEILSVIFFHESFQADKGVSLFLCLWGFLSYFYGEINNTPKIDHSQEDIPETQILLS